MLAVSNPVGYMRVPLILTEKPGSVDLWEIAAAV